MLSEVLYKMMPICLLLWELHAGLGDACMTEAKPVSQRQVVSLLRAFHGPDDLKFLQTGARHALSPPL